jgi:hypothetical protein
MKAIDLFAGWGGFTLGAEQAGVRVVWAANHWPLAVEAHARNHPHTEHACQDLRQADWTRLPAYDLLLASPACQGHSQASQPKRRAYHDAMRATAWAVVDCADVTEPRAIVVENIAKFERERANEFLTERYDAEKERDRWHQLACDRAAERETALNERDALRAERDDLAKKLDWEAALKTALAESQERLAARVAKLEAALRRIEKWFGEFPLVTGRDGKPSTFGTEYGSNGERDYMRQIARAALSEASVEQACEACADHVPFLRHHTCSEKDETP